MGILDAINDVGDTIRTGEDMIGTAVRVAGIFRRDRDGGGSDKLRPRKESADYLKDTRRAEAMRLVLSVVTDGKGRPYYDGKHSLEDAVERYNKDEHVDENNREYRINAHKKSYVNNLMLAQLEVDIANLPAAQRVKLTQAIKAISVGGNQMSDEDGLENNPRPSASALGFTEQDIVNGITSATPDWFNLNTANPASVRAFQYAAMKYFGRDTAGINAGELERGEFGPTTKDFVRRANEYFTGLEKDSNTKPHPGLDPSGLVLTPALIAYMKDFAEAKELVWEQQGRGQGNNQSAQNHNPPAPTPTPPPVSTVPVPDDLRALLARFNQRVSTLTEATTRLENLNAEVEKRLGGDAAPAINANSTNISLDQLNQLSASTIKNIQDINNQTKKIG